MSNEISKVDRTGLLGALSTNKPNATQGGLFIKMDRSGTWVFGPSSDEADVDKGKYAINLASLGHGWVLWEEGQMMGERFGPLTEPLGESPGAGYSKQYGFQLVGVAGEDEGEQFIYKSNSQGGINACAKLFSEIQAQIESGAEEIVPVVRLGHDSYQHRKYGRIYTPTFEVVEFVTEDAKEVSENVEELKPRRRRRS